MFAAPEEHPPDFDPRLDDCFYGKLVNGTWHIRSRHSGRWAEKKVITNVRFQGLEIARAQGLCPPGVPVFWYAAVKDWEDEFDKMDWGMTYEQAII
jgi:hypothetical protein